MQFFSYGRGSSWSRKFAGALGGALLLVGLAGCSLNSDEKSAQPDASKAPTEVVAAATQQLIGEDCSNDAECTTGMGGAGGVTTPVAGSVCGSGGKCECPPCTTLNVAGDSCDPVANDTPCGGSGDLCTATCQAGVCDAGSPVTCDADDFCSTKSCTAATGVCETTAANLGDGCDPNGGDPIVGCAGTCQANGTCGGASKTSECDATDTVCRNVSCDAGTGLCDAGVGQNLGTGCTGSSFGCNGTCQANGTCGGTSKTAECNGLDTVCADFTCLPATGQCDTGANQRQGLGCTVATGGFGCDGRCNAGVCTTALGSMTANCNGADSFCGNSECNAGNGTCSVSGLNTGTGCDPNGGSPVVGCGGICQANGTCNTTTTKTSECNGQDNLCRDVSCSAGTGLCTVAPQNLNVGCNTATSAVGCSGKCDAAGLCSAAQSKTAECNALDSRCGDYSCAAATGACTMAARNTGDGCNTGNPSTLGCGGICQGDGSCSTAQSMDNFCFNQATGNQCTTNLCGSTTGQCVEIPRTNQPCNDNAACTTGEQCNAAGQCRGGSTDNNACEGGAPICGVPTCNAASDGGPAGCTYPAKTIAEQCLPASPGTCKQAAVCNGTQNTCPAPANVANGTPCGAAASCNTTTAVITGQPLCNTGTCPAPGLTNCAPFNCTATPSPACRTTCANDTQCASTAFCNTATSLCETKRTNGTACTGTNQCVTGICSIPDGGAGPTEGVCCDTACNGQCESCATGTCSAVTAGQPVGQRTACSTHVTCGGSCQAGNRAGCTYPSGNVCVAEACTIDGDNEHFFQPQRTCSGGTCVNENVPASSCGAQICQQPGGCLGGCTNDSECAAGNYCPGAGVPCEPRKPVGETCTRSGECEAGVACVDGYCCDSGCSGQCEACNVAGKEGTCSPAVAGTQPVGARADCAGSGACQGTCDGTQRFACGFPGTATQCGTAACNGTQATPAGVCNGSGACAQAAAVECAPGACTNGSCDGDCSQCTGTQYCVAGRCVEKLTPGSSCVAAGDCQSGYCVDGVCCDGACGGQCEACNVTGSLGVCSAVPAGEGPRGARTACASDGSACGGTCDGTTRTTCEYPGVGLECRTASCGPAGTKNMATLAGFCQGNGSCSPPQTQVCPALGACVGNVCDGGCTIDGDCASGEFCSGGVCIALIPDGTACALDSQCANGNCVDGICCDTACDQACEECSTGTCSDRVGSPLPGRTPCTGTGPCGGTCTGTGPTCTLPGNSVSCGEASCVGGYAVAPSTCDGVGGCAPPTGSVCANDLLCNGTTCATTCTGDGDCAGELVCDNGACVEPPEPGTGGMGQGGATATGGATGAGGTSTGNGGSSNGTGGSDIGEGGTDGGLIPGIDEGTCGCKTAGGRAHNEGWFAVLAVVGLAAVRLRRRREAA